MCVLRDHIGMANVNVMMGSSGTLIIQLVFSIADHALVNITVIIIMMHVNHALKKSIGITQNA